MEAKQLERFERRIMPEPNTGCFLWLGAVNDKGYGQVNLNGRTQHAARVSYVVYVGPIPAGHEIRHKCHNRLCVNPAHLTTGTHAENIQDMLRAGRHKPGRGERHVNSVLNDDAVRAAKLLAQNGWSGQKIARALRVHAGTVLRILNGDGWNHVE